jgi:predicted nucleic acid-binding protein
MVLVDTSIWVSHFKEANDNLVYLLKNDEVQCHPFIIAEISCGTPPSPRAQTLNDLSLLKTSKIATMSEILRAIEVNKLYGKGCGYIDIALLTSVLVSENVSLWTLDKRLQTLAKGFDIAFSDPVTK